MTFSELVEARRSIRQFSDRDIPEEMLTALLEAAQAAPSAGNCQPWHFYVVRDRDIITKLCEASYRQTSIHTAPVTLVVCTEEARTIPRYGERGRHLYCIQDTAAAIQNILLCAKDLGLGTCWCGAFEEEAVSTALSLPKGHRPVAVIPVGWPEGEPQHRTGRRPLAEITTYV